MGRRWRSTQVKTHAEKVPAGRCRPGLAVPNLDGFHKRMERNVPCVQELKKLFGARIAQYLDPDGLAISVSEERRQAYTCCKPGTIPGRWTEVFE
jgi:hypothetical protein